MNSKEKALVSVILPVYNGVDYIEESIRSILNQTYSDFELIIIDDGSNDGTDLVIEKILDFRIKFIKRNNSGLVYTLNELISCCKGEYIARMDADDVSELDRIEKQVDVLNSGYDIVGSNVSLISNKGEYLGLIYYPQNEKEIINHLIFNSPFAHPVVMAKRWVFDIKYKEEYYLAEDYALWISAIFKYNAKIKNINESLLKYRVHEKSISRTNAIKQINIASLVRRELISKNDIVQYYYGATELVYRSKNTKLVSLFVSVVKFIVGNKVSKSSLTISLRCLKMFLKQKLAQ